jgi:MYXO-CTERM domain-containing protein
MSIGTHQKLAIAAGALSAVVASSASAADIDFTYSGVASGQWLNGLYSGQSFTNKAFTITLRGLTESVTALPNGMGYKTNTSGGIVTIADYGSFAVTSETAVWVNNTFGRSGFGIRDSGDIVGLGDNSFNTWNMQSSLGPITSTGTFNEAFSTTGGLLRFNGSTAVTFSATVVPAPGAVALVGLAGLAGSRRRRA